MTQRRWLRIIPVALIMYTISYVDRTNISLALDPNISSMMNDLLMDDRLKGIVAGIFFFGYVLLQIPGGYWATHWSPKKIISIFLVAWGICAVGCGLSRTFVHFGVMRFFLGVAESGVFPATTVLLANWFPRSERARANAYWNLCQPLAVAASAPFTGWLLGAYGWQRMIVIEGALPFIWLPIWIYFITDHPRDAKWISEEERTYLETTLKREIAELEPVKSVSMLERLLQPSIFVMIAIYFLHNCAAYGCMTFFTSGLKERGFSATQYGILFAIPYAVTAVIMVLNSWHSDKTHERRGHIALVYAMSGISLIASVLLRNHFWVSYAFMCLAIPGPFAAMAPFWAIPSETLPRAVMGLVVGLVNAFGNLGGFFGPYIVGWLKGKYHDISVPFNLLGVGMLLAAGLSLLLPKVPRQLRVIEEEVKQSGSVQGSLK
ncbi:MFS transporter [Pedosphaera parvula]|uniref:Major facilitator superfamily MFS_1 n=1 Tax=Pedosphaera parvula (strain Ellin514) TaxID=320771 RepID=B9XB69_PEDPL|nr:MFS transporter [Pedosphaera parvula]EEF62754.1 major facilitator superfamily MFS_1 [Pedosphaera parvula Ellin514]